MLTNQFILYTKLGSIKSSQDPQMMALRVSQLYFDNAELKEQLQDRINHKTSLQYSSNNNFETQKILEDESKKYKIILGLTEVYGQGVILTINHTLMTTQIVDLINALRNSGAEAISINEKRILTNTAFNQFEGQPNFVIKIIGNKDILHDSLTRPGGILDLTTSGSVERKDEIILPKAQ